MVSTWSDIEVMQVLEVPGQVKRHKTIIANDDFDILAVAA